MRNSWGGSELGWQPLTTVASAVRQPVIQVPTWRATLCRLGLALAGCGAVCPHAWGQSKHQQLCSLLPGATAGPAERR